MIAFKDYDCKIFIDEIEEEAMTQIKTLASHEAFFGAKIRIMPDCHAGAGCVIGFTANLGDKVVPNLVGVDISCGMYVAPIPKLHLDKTDFEQLDKVINMVVPSGRDVHTRRNRKATELIEELRCKKKLKNWDWLEKSLGTLGGGNHFIEIDEDKVNGGYYLIIHTGSRNIGKQVCDIYQKKAIDKLKGRDVLNEQRQKLIKTLKESGQQKLISEKLKELEAEYKPAVDIPDDLCYLIGEDKDDYLHDAEVCQKFANLNRETIARAIFKKMGCDWTPENNFTTLHNYIDQSDGVNIIRKGAVSAKEGERLLIPLNMKDGSLLCTGLGNEDWNCSAPHGAGRKMSRHKAFETLDMDEFKEKMNGIYSTCVVNSTLDESPMAYKSVNDIIDNISDTVKIDATLKPVYNYKAH